MLFSWHIMANATGMVSAQALKELKLSPEAQVFSRGEVGYVERTKRWQRWREPDVGAVVEVATAEDVAATVSRNLNIRDRKSVDQELFHNEAQLLCPTPPENLSRKLVPSLSNNSNMTRFVSQTPTTSPSLPSPAATVAFPPSAPCKTLSKSTCAN